MFGDRSRSADPRDCLAGIDSALAAIATMAAGIARHSAITSVLIDAGCLLQGVADADFDEVGRDRMTPQTEALGQWLMALARLTCQSWDSSFAELGEMPALPELTVLPQRVRLKAAEGFAFYALYPEASIEAARRLRLTASPRVIGIRSIGTTLGPVVAAALDAEPPVTLRPFGNPFARQIAVEADLEDRLLQGDPHFVVVDEGPGQSGSSFGAVADWLQQRGVPLERIAFIPSHDGPPGPQASEPHRRQWAEAQRGVADFGDRLPQLVGAWAGELLGGIDGVPRDTSGGAWRFLACREEAEWPPVIAMFERRKFLADSGGSQFLAKFAGLGSVGEDKLRMANGLYAAGFAAEPIGLAHGFLVERWIGDAAPLSPRDHPVQEIGQYLGTRARLFPAADDAGASVAELAEMIRRNVSLGLGEDAAVAVQGCPPARGGLRRVHTDNRLDRHEWLRTADGRLLKTDALDHCQGHDLVGCQDLAWDVAGAIAEFGLSPEETEDLIAAAEQASGTSIDRMLLNFCSLAYAAFRFGLASLGADLACQDDEEGQRLRVEKSLRLGQLEARIAATRQECSVG